MAFNLFDNILQSSTNKFLGTQPSVPSTPSFTAPQAPRTANYTQPVKNPIASIRNSGFAPWYENTVDETQSTLFKWVQWAANLFTGVKKRLGETVQSDLDRKQQQVDKEGIEFAQFLADQGYDENQIMSWLDNLKSEWKLTVSPNFSERLVGNLANRMGEVQRTTERLANEPIATRLATGIPSYAGDVVGTAFEPIVSAVSPALEYGVKKLWAEKTVQNLGSQWEEVRKQYPNVADAIEGVANVSQLFPLSPKVTAPIKSGLKTATAKTVATAKQVAPKITDEIASLRNNIAIKNAKKAQALTDEWLKEIYEAVNPTTRENKAVLRQRVEDLLPYIDENKRFSNDLETVKGRVDTDKSTAYKAMEDYETNVWVKWKVDTDSVAKAIADKYQEKIGNSFINADEAKIAQQLIDTLQWFWKTVDDANIIKIRRAWDKIIEKNKWFMQSAEATSKGDIFADANRFFRDEIKKSNPAYAKFLEKAHKTITLSDILDATIQRRTGQTQGGFIRKASENTARVIGTGLWTVVGGIPWAFVWAWATEALLAGVNKLTGSSTKLAKWKKLILKSQKNGTSINNISNSRNPSVVGKSEQLTSWPRLKKPIIKPKK